MKLVWVLFFPLSILSAAEFTIGSYNCGCLSAHYDYLRAATLQKVMQERYTLEPEEMAQNERIQQIALKILFSSDPEEKLAAEREWEQKGYQEVLDRLTAMPNAHGSVNKYWFEKVESMITSFRVRPVKISDEEVEQLLNEHLNDLSQADDQQQQLLEARTRMGKRIFAHHMKFDIITLQEADYLDPSMFPPNYEVLFNKRPKSLTGIAWNKERFELIEPLEGLGKNFAVKLRDLETGKVVLVASGHFTGANPYRVEINPENGSIDSAEGDAELQMVVDFFEEQEADLKLIGMDSNVTSLHPRLHILKDAEYRLDYENHLDQTCSNPYMALNTRLDWIVLKSNEDAKITNVPVNSVNLNNIQTNMSDHRPIAAKISY